MHFLAILEKAPSVEGELVDVPLKVVLDLEELLAGSVGASPGGGVSAEAAPRTTGIAYASSPPARLGILLGGSITFVAPEVVVACSSSV